MTLLDYAIIATALATTICLPLSAWALCEWCWSGEELPEWRRGV